MDEQLIWEADRQIVVNFGNAGVVELILLQQDGYAYIKP